MKQIQKILLPFFLMGYLSALAQTNVSVKGMVVDADNGKPIVGATLKIRGTVIQRVTDQAGLFSFRLPAGNWLIDVSHLAYSKKEHPLPLQADSLSLRITLSPLENLMDEVIVSTGYDEVPIERTTGSFTKIDTKLLERSVSTDIISRLEGVTNSLHFDRRSADRDAPALRVRGISTIYADKAPLIVLDNFPYEGDINSINPNDIASVTVLKDAAAASIWGVRAGNGVIVITTKKGAEGRSTVNFSANTNLLQKPDLYYNPKFLNASDFIGVETSLFERGFYTENDWTALSPAVELLISKRDGLIDEGAYAAAMNELSNNDVRQQAHKYLYRQAINQQYALSLSGASKGLNYLISGGYDRNLGEKIGDKSGRYTLNINNTYKPAGNDKWQVTTNFNYVRHNSANNGIGIDEIISGNGNVIYPYAKLVDHNGNALPVVRDYRQTYVANALDNGLLDWAYYPVNERWANDNLSANTEFRANLGVNYALYKGINLDAKYQYFTGNRYTSNLNTQDAYYVRDVINRFTQADGTRVFPEGSVYNVGNNRSSAQSFRLQGNMDRTFGRHQVRALLGGEVREVNGRGERAGYYGYDGEVLTTVSRLDFLTRYPTLPRGTSQLPLPASGLSETVDRFLSGYFNGAYTYAGRYTGSVSARWDASNLFGVKTNQKGVALWSLGASWLVSNEPFYQLDWLSLLKLRVTYGYNGNIDRSVTAYPTAAYATDVLTGMRQARIISPGNPNLRWETIGILNLGLDFATKNNRVKGSVEYYQKRGYDLLGNVMIDPTLGYDTGLGTRYRINYANLFAYGVDIDVTTENVKGSFEWQTQFIWSVLGNKVTRYTGPSSTSGFASNIGTYPREGKPLEALYSSPWYGLDPETGDPLVFINGQSGKNYTEFVRSLSDWEALIYHGQTVPPLFGSVRNRIAWRNFSLDFNLTIKLNYFFRRSSINYGQLINNGEGHLDFGARWQQMGDENFTQVPSMPMTPIPANRDAVYLNSPLLVESGSHIRLQDLNLSYDFKKLKLADKVNNLRLFVYARNLGFIYRANKQGLDPDYPNSSLVPGKSFALGLTLSL